MTYSWYAFGSTPVFQERVRGDKQVSSLDIATFKVMSRDEGAYECFETLAKLVLRYVKGSFSSLQDDFL